MGQEKINWTLDVITQLQQQGVGNHKKLEEIRCKIANTSEVSKKESNYLKKQFEELEKKKEKDESKVCLRCRRSLGFMKYKSKDYWGHKGNLCWDCYDHLNKSHKSYEGKYIEGTLDLKSGKGIELHVNSFDEGKLIITSKSQLFKFPIQSLQKIVPFYKKENSIANKIMTAAHQEKTTSELMKLKFENDEISEQIIILKIKNPTERISEIRQLQRLCEARGYKETISSPQSQQKVEENIPQNYGSIIKETPAAQYYGGHKAYLAGGSFSDAQNGKLFLTDRYLIFIKNAMRESKKWKIAIPLEKVIVEDWKVDEKTRRKSMVGGGAGFGLFGGGGVIHDTGKAHDIVVPYVDENGITQAPRFGVTSLSGNAIRDWAKIIYDQLVTVNKIKQTQNNVPSGNNQDKTQEDPIKLLKIRLAKGEITKEEFEELRKLIE